MAAGTKKPNIRGGDYTAVRGSDGWVILKDIPTMAPVAKGTKGAPSDIEREWLEGAVKFGQDAYSTNKICYPVHTPHNDDLGLTTPEFLGYFRPTKVGTIQINGKDQQVVFSDLKLKSSAFDRIQSGELPYLSPEIRSWAKKSISSVALLSSQPPHFPFPNLTVKDVVEDPSAVFSADLPNGVTVAKFEDGKDRLSFDPSEPDGKPDESKPGGSKCCEHCKTNQEAVKKMSDTIYGGSKMESGKPDGKPVDQTGTPEPTKQGGAKMEAEDPKLAAKFAMYEDKISSLTKRMDEREQAEKSKASADKAIAEDLKGYQIGDKTRAAVYKFAAEGPERLKEYIESVKEVAMKDSPGSLFAAELAGAVKMNDPLIVKFGQNDPDKMEKAAKFAADYRTLKKSGAGKGMRLTEEDWIKQAMSELDGGNA